MSLKVLNRPDGEVAHDVHDIILVNETHFKIDLSELGLSVGARILVAKTFADLQVPVTAGDHENLLEELWTLRQRVPLSRIHARGDDEVACAFGRAPNQQRRFNFEKAMFGEEVPGMPSDFTAESEDRLHARAAKIDVPMSKSDLLVNFIRFMIVGKDRWIFSAVEAFEGRADQFNRTGIKFRVGASIANSNGAGDGDDILTTKSSGLLHHVIGHIFLIEDDLSQPRAVSKIDEDKPLALITVGIDPAAQCGT